MLSKDALYFNKTLNDHVYNSVQFVWFSIKLEFFSLSLFYIFWLSLYCSNFGGPKFLYNRSIVRKHILVTIYCITLGKDVIHACK